MKDRHNRQHVNPFVLIYHITIFVPIALITTIICAVATCIMIPICGDTKWGYYPGMIWAKILCTTALVKVKIEGQNHIAPKQSYIFAANHQSIFDVFLVYGWLGVKFRWIMKKELRMIPFVGKACEMMGHIFINRSNAIAAKRSLEAAEKQLQKGGSIFMFPEGTRTKTGAVGKFKRGALVIARDLKLPIVPVSIVGAYEVMPYHAWYIQPGIIKLIIHKPIPTKGLSDADMHTAINIVQNSVASALQQNTGK